MGGTPEALRDGLAPIPHVQTEPELVAGCWGESGKILHSQAETQEQGEPVDAATALLAGPPRPYSRLVKAALVQPEQDNAAGDMLARLLTELRSSLHRNFSAIQRLMQDVPAYGPAVRRGCQGPQDFRLGSRKASPI